MSLEKEIKRQMRIISEGTEEILPLNELEVKLKKSITTQKPLRIKMGIDPTASDVHIGHMVVYKKIRQLQDLGHHAHLIIGDYTARIGDPTGRNQERKALSERDVNKNCETYQKQIFKMVDQSKTTIHYQSSWFDEINLSDLLTTTSKFSVAHMLSHETFKNRLESGERLSLHEMLYPVLQAWDSVAVEADIEFGGMDQKFNILCGRDLQKENGMDPQIAIFMPLLMGTDGRKMSKSFNNHISVLSKPNEKFGKIMSIRDELIPSFFKYATHYKEDQINEIERRLNNENPRDLKLLLAREIISIYHSLEEALACEKEFINIFSKKELPKEIPEINVKPGEYRILNLLVENQLTTSISEGRRLIQQGGLKINNNRMDNEECILSLKVGEDTIIKAGKRRFMKIACIL